MENLPTIGDVKQQYLAFFSQRLSQLKEIRDRYFTQDSQESFLKSDLLITGILIIVWFLFAWQYGFYNSPDSWYRGVLGKSIADGHPYWINLKQGWLYDFGAWHHDATHEPLLPIIYAVFFLIFGNKIIIANIVSVLSAALLAFPLLRLSRQLFQNNIWPAVLIYVLLILNLEASFLFEVTAGLSIPTLLLALTVFLFCFWQLLEADRQLWFWGSIVSIVSFYYVRSDAQLLFFWLMLWSLMISFKWFERQVFFRVGRMWLISLAFVLPWLVRKFVLFGSPFFSHITPMVWADRAYDYWSYHETMPLPGPGAYFLSHSWLDFIYKIFVRGLGNVYSVFDNITFGPFWLYLLAFIFSALIVWRFARDRSRRAFYSLGWLVFFGYVGVYVLVPGLENRYMMPLYFLLMLTIISALFFVFQQQERRVSAKVVFYLAIIALTGLLTKDIWQKNYFPFSFYSSDKELRQDVSIPALKNNIAKDKVILGPFADSQRLAFATGLTYIEIPDNLNKLIDPPAFFRKYNIQYSLVDVGKLLPPRMIAGRSMAGNKILYQLDLSGQSSGLKLAQFAEIDLLSEPKIRQAVAGGVNKRIAYIDAYHAAELGDFSALTEFNIQPFVGRSDLVSAKNQLFQSGLLLLNYEMGQREFTEPELLVIEQYIANGGRILLMCPAWVWVAYEHKGLERLPYYQIARKFGLLLTADYVDRPFSFVGKKYNFPGILPRLEGAFSAIIYDAGEPILVGRDNKAAAVLARRGKAKILVWAQNNLLDGKLSADAEGRSFLKQIFASLLSND